MTIVSTDVDIHLIDINFEHHFQLSGYIDNIFLFCRRKKHHSVNFILNEYKSN